MIPVFLEILITDVFTIYTTLYSWKTGALKLKVILQMMIWNFYQTVPVYIVILLGSKITEKAQRMIPIIGKLINSCDDQKVLERVNYFVLL